MINPKHITTLDDAMSFAAEQGIKLTASDYRQIAELQATVESAAAEPASAAESQIAKVISTFNTYYPQFLQFLHRVGDVIITMMQTVIVALGNPAILILLLWVEHARVVYGLELFETDHKLAWLGAWAIVLLNLTLEFTVHYVEHKSGYHAERATRFSLRSWARSAKYFFGVGNDDQKWQPTPLSPAQQYRNLSRVVTMTILILALAGSMKGAIEKVSSPEQPGAAAPRWYDALESIAKESTLLEMATWSSGLVFAIAAILGVQKTASYIAIRCAEIVAKQDSQRRRPDESAAIQYVMAKVAQTQMKSNGHSNGNGGTDFLAVGSNGNGWKNGNGNY